jgi:hypothetical protein
MLIYFRDNFLSNVIQSVSGTICVAIILAVISNRFLFEEIHKVCKAKGIETCIRTPELEENHAIHNLWKNFNSKINKRRRTYKKEL